MPKKFLPYIRHISHCLYQSGRYTFVYHDGIEHAGYLAYLTLLSLFPFLVLIVMMAGALGEAHISGAFIATMLEQIPEHLIAALQPRVQEIVSGPPEGILTLALIGMIWTASSTVEGLRTILNRAYRVATPPAYIWRRLLSIIQFLALTIAVIIAMLLQILVPIIWKWLQHWVDLSAWVDPLWSYIRIGFSGLLMFLAVTTSYYILPNTRHRWTSNTPGAVVVLLLWIFWAEMLTLYFQHFSQISLIYGSLASIIVTLVFFYLIALCYIFGAEFNYFFARRRTEHLKHGNTDDR